MPAHAESAAMLAASHKRLPPFMRLKVVSLTPVSMATSLMVLPRSFAARANVFIKASVSKLGIGALSWRIKVSNENWLRPVEIGELRRLALELIARKAAPMLECVSAL